MAAFVAIAWSATTPDLGRGDVAPGQKAALLLTHPPAALDAWAPALRLRFAARPMAGGLAPSRGPRSAARVNDAFGALSPIPPTTLAKSRDAFSPSRAQAAPREADSRLALLVQQRDRLKAGRPAHAQTRTRHSLVASRRRLGNDRPRLSHRLSAVLNAYFPPVCHWCDAIRPFRVCEVRLRWPTVEARKKGRPAPLETFVHAPNAVRSETLSPRMTAITEAGPVTTAQAVRPAGGRMVQAFAPPLKTTIAALRAWAPESEPLWRTPAADPRLAALPGAGTVYAARLTAARGPVRDRGTTGDARRGVSGVAPVLERRGPSTWRRWRAGCPKFLRPSCHASAGASIHHAFGARASSRSQRARGTRQQAAVRALAFQWLRISDPCWQTPTPYSDVSYLERLRRKGAPLLAFAANTPS